MRKFFTKVPFDTKKYFFTRSSVPFRNFSFATLLDYKRAEQSDRCIQFLISYKLSTNKRVAVAFEQRVAVAYSCVSQAVIVIIIIVSVKLYSGT